MKNINKIKMNYIIITAILPLMLLGCNTIEGVGTDISCAGHGLEHAAEAAKQPSCSSQV